jgi:threonine dehydrogenase-like Zn-dependent dehydrogenase
VHVARRTGLRAGESAAILGTGSIGGLVSGVCRSLEVEPIIVADVRQHCLDAAVERLGATHELLLPDDGLADKVRALTGGEGVAVAFVTADDVALVSQGIDMAKRRGRIALVALLTHASLQIRAFDMISKELSMLGSLMCTSQDVQRALELAASGQVDVEGILTHVLPIEEAQRGMELAHTKDDGAIKVILTFS